MTKDEAMQMALDALNSMWNMDKTRKHHEAIEALEAALAQPEPEHRDVVIAGDLWRVEFLPNNDANVMLVRAGYTDPPQREWKRLTDEEIIEVIHPLVMADMADEATDCEIARAIEAKLWEKNHMSGSQRKPLSDEEMFKLWVRAPAETENRFAFARAIEAAHGIKD